MALQIANVVDDAVVVVGNADVNCDANVVVVVAAADCDDVGDDVDVDADVANMSWPKT